jgi:CPA2 family monovalent cation:H+ antiporter-2
MLFDPMTLFTNPWPLLGALAIVVIGKSVAALAIMQLFKQKRAGLWLVARCAA